MPSVDDLCNQFLKNGIVIAHLNVQSLLPKIEEIHNHVSNSAIKILSVNETFLNSDIHNSEIEIPGFTIFRNDFSRKGGGVALYICESYSPSLVKTFSRTNHVEAISVTVRIGNIPFNISSVYRQPTTDVISFMQLDNVLEDILSLNSNSIFLGDLKSITMPQMRLGPITLKIFPIKATD